MNKKRFVIFIGILICIIVAVIVTINLNKNNNDESIETQENVKTYTDDEWKEYASAFYQKSTENTPVDIKLYTDGVDVMIIEIYDTNEENANFVERYNLNYKTGVGTDLKGNKVDLELK